jgi:hypothetical protein
MLGPYPFILPGVSVGGECSLYTNTPQGAILHLTTFLLNQQIYQ